LCNYSGQVFVSRNTGEASDYRDDVYSSDLGCSEPTAISSVITFRALDFGDSGIRKLVRKVIGHYRAASGTVEGVSLQYANDLKTVFQDTTDFTLFTYNKDNLSDYGYRKVESVAHSIGEQRSQYLQLKLTADGLDESVDFVGFDYQVEGLSSSGIPQAADT
jgi:hypothetical protein